MEIKTYDTTVHTVKPVFKSLLVQKSGLFARFSPINTHLFLKSTARQSAGRPASSMPKKDSQIALSQQSSAVSNEGDTTALHSSTEIV